MFPSSRFLSPPCFPPFFRHIPAQRTKTLTLHVICGINPTIDSWLLRPLMANEPVIRSGHKHVFPFRVPRQGLDNLRIPRFVLKANSERSVQGNPQIGFMENANKNPMNVSKVILAPEATTTNRRRNADDPSAEPRQTCDRNTRRQPQIRTGR